MNGWCACRSILGEYEGGESDVLCIVGVAVGSEMRDWRSEEATAVEDVVSEFEP